MSADPTLAVYDRMASEYETMAAAGSAPGMELFLETLRPGSRVLDLGCGPGLDAAAIAAAGHEVLAVDGSAKMVALAGTRPGITVRRAMFDEIGELGRFDGIWASFSLLHAPRQAFRRHLDDLRATAAPGAVFGMGMKLGEGEGTDRLGRFYAYYSEEELRDLLARAGFVPVGMLTGEHAGLAGVPEPWIFLLSHA